MEPRRASYLLLVLAAIAAMTTCSVLLTMTGGIAMFGPGKGPASDDDVHAARREQMVRALAASGLGLEPHVLDAMERTPRHLFVPDEHRHVAYRDTPLPLSSGQAISAPGVVARMTQLLNVSVDDRVLEVGTGSGYQAAVLAQVVQHVYTIEILPELAETAAARLAELGYSNVTVRSGDGYLGWPEEAPFDGIIVTCAPTDVPEPLCAQLAEGGRMVIPLGPQSAVQWLTVLEKRDGALVETRSVAVLFVPMTGIAGRSAKDGGPTVDDPA